MNTRTFIVIFLNLHILTCYQITTHIQALLCYHWYGRLQVWNFISFVFDILCETGEHSKTASSISTSSTGNNNITTPGLVRMTEDVQRQSPPKAIVDSSPLQPQMDKNKECKWILHVYTSLLLCLQNLSYKENLIATLSGFWLLLCYISSTYYLTNQFQSIIITPISVWHKKIFRLYDAKRRKSVLKKYPSKY